jgi:hypothetical protein
MADCVGIVGVGLMGQAFSHHPMLRFKAEGRRRKADLAAALEGRSQKAEGRPAP